MSDGHNSPNHPSHRIHGRSSLQPAAQIQMTKPTEASVNGDMTNEQRETAARILASRMMMADWQDLRPFTRAKYRTAILTMERIFDIATGRRVLSQREKK